MYFSDAGVPLSLCFICALLVAAGGQRGRSLVLVLAREQPEEMHASPPYMHQVYSGESVLCIHPSWPLCAHRVERRGRAFGIKAGYIHRMF